MTTFDTVLARFPWREIRDCPGRFVMRPKRADLTPAHVVGAAVPIETFDADETPDRIALARFPGGGLLSFGKPDGTWIHALNTESGLSRRLARLNRR